MFDNSPAFNDEIDEIRGQLALDYNQDPNLIDEMSDEEVFRLWEQLKDERQTTGRSR